MVQRYLIWAQDYFIRKSLVVEIVYLRIENVWLLRKETMKRETTKEISKKVIRLDKERNVSGSSCKKCLEDRNNFISAFENLLNASLCSQKVLVMNCLRCESIYGNDVLHSTSRCWCVVTSYTRIFWKILRHLWIMGLWERNDVIFLLSNKLQNYICIIFLLGSGSHYLEHLNRLYLWKSVVQYFIKTYTKFFVFPPSYLFSSPSSE